MERVLGHETWWWVATDSEGKHRGVLPLVRVTSRLFGDYLLSMPFMSYGGPLGSVPARKALSKWALAEAGRLGVDLLELRVREPMATELSVSTRKVTVLKSLPSSTEELWEEGIRSKVRSQIRRPMKEGMTVRIDGDLLEPFYDVFSRTMRDLGTPVLPKSFFAAIAEHLADVVVFACVEHDGLPVAGGCGFLWQGEFEITWAGARRDFSRESPNMLLYWSLMEESVRRGAHTFNFGRCTPDSGTHRFKRQWDTADQVLPWAQWSPHGLVATPNPDSRKFRLATSAWSRLPVPVANALGPSLARVLP